MPAVVRAKEIEAAAENSAEFRASIQVIMSNHGHQDKEELRSMTGEKVDILRESRG